MGRNFVPHPQCTVASGDCFTEGRCLSQCRAQARAKDAETIRELERRVLQLERPIGPFCGKGDPLYVDAVKEVTASGKPSTARIQRVFRIGYNRASYMIEAMEADGIVSAPNYKGQRLVLAKPTRDGDGGRDG